MPFNIIVLLCFQQEQWEELQRPLFNYIRTEAKPVICYLPKVHNEKTTELLQQCQQKLTSMNSTVL